MAKHISMIKGSHRIQVSESRKKYYEGHGYKLLARPGKRAEEKPADPKVNK